MEENKFYYYDLLLGETMEDVIDYSELGLEELVTLTKDQFILINKKQSENKTLIFNDKKQLLDFLSAEQAKERESQEKEAEDKKSKELKRKKELVFQSLLFQQKELNLETKKQHGDGVLDSFLNKHFLAYFFPTQAPAISNYEQQMFDRLCSSLNLDSEDKKFSFLDEYKVKNDARIQANLAVYVFVSQYSKKIEKAENVEELQKLEAEIISSSYEQVIANF